MNNVSENECLRSGFVPRWTWRSVVLAAVMTLGLFLLIPGFERLSAPPENEPTLHSVTTIRRTQPPLPPPEIVESLPPRPRSPATAAPVPELAVPSRRLPMPPVAMNPALALDGVGGEIAVDLDFGYTVAMTAPSDSVFRLSDLDTAPRLLARRDPLYPHLARVRGIEGFALAAFTVTEDGSVRDIQIIDSDPDGLFDQATVDAVRRWRFTPGIRNDAPMPVRVEQKVTFQLE